MVAFNSVERRLERAGRKNGAPLTARAPNRGKIPGRNHFSRAGKMKRIAAITLFAAGIASAYAGRSAFIWGEEVLRYQQKRLACSYLADVLLTSKPEKGSISNLTPTEFGKVVKLIDKECWKKS